nr:MAG TPA: hypothetical protein [Caudoviricetes sp.]
MSVYHNISCIICQYLVLICYKCLQFSGKVLQI